MKNLDKGKKDIFFLFIAMFQCNLIFAQVVPVSSGSYSRDLGAVTAEIRGAQWIADICAETYPDLKPKNQEAVDNWRNRYEPFIAEMNSRFEALPKYWAVTEPRGAEARPGLWEEFLRKQLEAARNVVSRQFMAQGQAKKRLICVGFSQALASERWNLERYHINEVATIRRGRN